MKHQKVANRNERLIFEDMVQKDKITKSSGNNFNSQRVGTHKQQYPTINNINNNNLNTNRSNSNHTTQSINKNNSGLIQQNFNSTLMRNAQQSNNSSEKLGVNNLSKRDRIWKERRNIKLNSENSKLVNNSSSHNQIKQINNIATPFNIYERNQVNMITPNRVDSIQTPNQNPQVYNVNSRTNGPTNTHNNNINDFNPNIKSVNTGNLNNRLERTNTTPLPLDMNDYNRNFRQNPNSNTTYNNPIREAHNFTPMNTQNINQNYLINNSRSNPTPYAVTPNNNSMNLTIPNHRQGNHTQYNTSANYPVNTPSNTMPNYYNSVATPNNNISNNYGLNQTKLTGNHTNVIQNPMQFNRGTPSQYNNTATPNSNRNQPMRNIISHTPLPTSNINYNYSKPGSSQSNKPFANENISFRNSNNITPGNIPANNRIYSANLGRDNNKFIFDKNNVIY
jgi:hypothetical protein